jgi:fatty acid desaturase
MRIINKIKNSIDYLPYSEVFTVLKKLTKEIIRLLFQPIWTILHWLYLYYLYKWLKINFMNLENGKSLKKELIIFKIYFFTIDLLIQIRKFK